jgi:hypothetical protein
VTLFEWFFSPRSKRDWKSWWALSVTLPFVFCLAFLISESMQQTEVGARQQLASGIITAYEPSNHDSCRYTFAIQGREFNGIGSCPMHPGIVGAQVRVYYDPMNPATSSLEDFLEARKRNRGVIFISMLGICAVTALILYSKLKAQKSKARLGPL